MIDIVDEINLDFTFQSEKYWCTIASVWVVNAYFSLHSSFVLANLCNWVELWWSHRCIRRWNSFVLNIHADPPHEHCLLVCVETIALFAVSPRIAHGNFPVSRSQFVIIWSMQDLILLERRHDSRCNARKLFMEMIRNFLRFAFNSLRTVYLELEHAVQAWWAAVWKLHNSAILSVDLCVRTFSQFVCFFA